MPKYYVESLDLSTVIICKNFVTAAKQALIIFLNKYGETDYELGKHVVINEAGPIGHYDIIKDNLNNVTRFKESIFFNTIPKDTTKTIDSIICIKTSALLRLIKDEITS